MLLDFVITHLLKDVKMKMDREELIESLLIIKNTKLKEILKSLCNFFILPKSKRQELQDFGEFFTSYVLFIDETEEAVNSSDLKEDNIVCNLIKELKTETVEILNMLLLRPDLSLAIYGKSIIPVGIN